ncbi:MAG: NAD(P)/FAD-dependent oxidoreductase [Polyangiaceae bacterium]|nr:NAD(P)/FAD-dependent oxidoreductase [Polyangiaceae bacterium]
MASQLAGKWFDVVVIGSGIGGLVAALTAARAGQSVAVLEAAKQFGGYINPFRRGKYRFDPGLHYIGECGPGQLLTRVLQSVDLADTIRFRELNPEGFERIVFPGYEITMPRGAENYRDKLIKDFPHEKQGIDEFFELLRQFRAAMKVIQKVDGLPAAIDAVPHVPFLLKYGRATYADLLNPIIKDPLLRAVLSAQSGDYGLPPRRASALIGLGLIDHYIRGAYFPVGGSGAMRDALVQAITKHGGLMLRNTPVEKILLDNGSVKGVRTAAGEEVQTRTVISNADAAHTYRTLVGEQHLPFLLKRRVVKNRLSVASICVFLGTNLDLTQCGMTDANIWVYPTTDLDRFYEPIYKGQIPDLDFFFLSSPSLKDPGHALPGCDTVELVTLAPFEPFAKWEGGKSMKRGDEYETFKQSLFDRYTKAAERFIPKLREHVKVSEVSTPVTNITYATAPRGAIYGPEVTPDQIGPFRFGIKGAFDGLFFCGAAVHGGGVVPAAISGMQAGKRAAQWALQTRPIRGNVPVPQSA